MLQVTTSLTDRPWRCLVVAWTHQTWRRCRQDRAHTELDWVRRDRPVSHDDNDSRSTTTASANRLSPALFPRSRTCNDYSVCFRPVSELMIDFCDSLMTVKQTTDDIISAFIGYNRISIVLISNDQPNVVNVVSLHCSTVSDRKYSRCMLQCFVQNIMHYLQLLNLTWYHGNMIYFYPSHCIPSGLFNCTFLCAVVIVLISCIYSIKVDNFSKTL